MDENATTANATPVGAMEPELRQLVLDTFERDFQGHKLASTAATTLAILLTDLVDRTALSPESTPVSLVRTLRALAEMKLTQCLLPPEVMQRLMAQRSCSPSAEASVQYAADVQAVAATMLAEAARHHQCDDGMSSSEDEVDANYWSEDEGDECRGGDAESLVTVADIATFRHNSLLRPMYMHALVASGLFVMPQNEARHAIPVRRRWPLPFVVQVLQDEWKGQEESAFGLDALSVKKKAPVAPSCWGGSGCTIA